MTMGNESDELFGDDSQGSSGEAVVTENGVPVTDGDGEKRIPEDQRPDYDPEKIAAAFPDVGRMDFSEKDDGVIVAKLVDREMNITEVDIGTELPPDTDALIECISSYMNATVDSSLLDEAADALDF